MRFWDILRSFRWLCEGVCNLLCMCYGCYTESKSYGYAIVDPFGRFAPSVLLRSFRYAKLRLRQICRFCVSKWRCSAAKANFSYSPKASSFYAQDDTFTFSCSWAAGCRGRQPLQWASANNPINPNFIENALRLLGALRFCENFQILFTNRKNVVE